MSDPKMGLWPVPVLKKSKKFDIVHDGALSIGNFALMMVQGKKVILSLLT
jgi:hypothetical protein